MAKSNLLKTTIISRAYRSYAQYREPRFSPFKKYLLADFLFTFIQLITCPAISSYNFWLKIILIWEILSLLCIPIFPNFTQYRPPL